jgi:hypothetical protein
MYFRLLIFADIKKVNYNDLLISVTLGTSAFSGVFQAKWHRGYLFPKRNVAVKITNTKNEKTFIADVIISRNISAFLLLFNRLKIWTD